MYVSIVTKEVVKRAQKMIIQTWAANLEAILLPPPN
jgi:hypothetical protein